MGFVKRRLRLNLESHVKVCSMKRGGMLVSLKSNLQPDLSLRENGLISHAKGAVRLAQTRPLGARTGPRPACTTATNRPKPCAGERSARTFPCWSQIGQRALASRVRANRCLATGPQAPKRETARKVSRPLL